MLEDAWHLKYFLWIRRLDCLKSFVCHQISLHFWPDWRLISIIAVLFFGPFPPASIQHCLSQSCLWNDRFACTSYCSKMLCASLSLLRVSILNVCDKISCLKFVIDFIKLLRSVLNIKLHYISFTVWDKHKVHNKSKASSSSRDIWSPHFPLYGHRSFSWTPRFGWTPRLNYTMLELKVSC